MPVLATTHPTLLDVQKRTAPDGSVDKVIEILDQTNKINEDMVWLPANDKSQHVTTIRSGLPEPTWRKLYQFTQPTKSTTVQVTDSIGMLEAWSEIDQKLVEIQSDPAAFRLSEDIPHMESMMQKVARTVFYGNDVTAPEEWTGLAARYSTTSAENADQIIKGDGAGSDNTSIWIVVWGPNTVHGIYPPGTKAGISHNDLGLVTLQESGGRMRAYQSHYTWDCGLSLRDWRYCVRVCNIDVSNLTKNAASGSDLVDLITQGLEVIPNLEAGRAVIYANRKIRSFLRRQITNKVANSTLSMDNVAGKPVMAIDGIPVKKCDVILNTEATVS